MIMISHMVLNGIELKEFHSKKRQSVHELLTTPKPTKTTLRGIPMSMIPSQPKKTSIQLQMENQNTKNTEEGQQMVGNPAENYDKQAVPLFPTP